MGQARRNTLDPGEECAGVPMSRNFVLLRENGQGKEDSAIYTGRAPRSRVEKKEERGGEPPGSPRSSIGDRRSTPSTCIKGGSGGANPGMGGGLMRGDWRIRASRKGKPQKKIENRRMPIVGKKEITTTEEFGRTRDLELELRV